MVEFLWRDTMLTFSSLIKNRVPLLVCLVNACFRLSFYSYYILPMFFQKQSAIARLEIYKDALRLTGLIRIWVFVGLAGYFLLDVIREAIALKVLWSCITGSSGFNGMCTYTYLCSTASLTVSTPANYSTCILVLIQNLNDCLVSN